MYGERQGFKAYWFTKSCGQPHERIFSHEYWLDGLSLLGLENKWRSPKTLKGILGHSQLPPAPSIHDIVLALAVGQANHTVCITYLQLCKHYWREHETDYWSRGMSGRLSALSPLPLAPGFQAIHTSIWPISLDNPPPCNLTFLSLHSNTLSMYF